MPWVVSMARPHQWPWRCCAPLDAALHHSSCCYTARRRDVRCLEIGKVASSGDTDRDTDTLKIDGWPIFRCELLVLESVVKMKNHMKPQPSHQQKHDSENLPLFCSTSHGKKTPQQQQTWAKIKALATYTGCLIGVHYNGVLYSPHNWVGWHLL